MPKNKDIKRFLLLDWDQLLLDRAAEFDYAGTRACRALKRRRN